jgi:predicted permease
MFETLTKILAVILIFPLGYFLKRVRILKESDGEFLLRLVFYVSLPALILISVTKIRFETEFIFLPISAILILLMTYPISSFIARKFGLPKTTFGVFMIATLIMNIGFTIPFVIAGLGIEGFARLSVFDLGNSLFVYTLTYSIAYKYGDNPVYKPLYKKLLMSIPLWALVIAIILNLTHIGIPDFPTTFLKLLGDMTIPSLMLSIGLYFNPKVMLIKPLSSAIFIRMGIGFILGFALCWFFGLTGINRQIVIIGACSPVGYNTLIFSSLEHLNKDFAASLISFSILIGIIVTSLLVIFNF